MTTAMTGGCSCGGIRYTCTAEAPTVYACHCTSCHRRTGSAFGISLRVPADSLRIDKGSLKQFQRIADSGNVITVNFCPDCGNAIFSQGANPALRILYGGTLDDFRQVAVDFNIWTDSAAPWVHLDPGLPSFPGQPPVPGQAPAPGKPAEPAANG